ncbi:carbonic anhydrase [Halorhodospira halochloris]|uniref:carbonic anhydrase n=1 Tax=Halorhodospira halochloris TaxID=1052 RepID=A0A120MZY7_HALHR|nr:carbonic anhydrase [Halorhodospira halochloris]MBK1652605.1 hypothetical protein [Halorhodospira halochloris]BAU58196.1 carbonic anhydrase [Halorhodospira halochloris]
MLTPSAALARLKEGNQRFVHGELCLHERMTHQRRLEVAAKQQPFAAILGCADSRVPAEEVFDQGVGDLFVVRVAGNYAGRGQIGSLEYAAEVLSVPLIVVLGHSCCGAIGATVDSLRSQSRAPSDALQEIIDELQPSVRPLLGDTSTADAEIIEEATIANVRSTAERLSAKSELLERAIQQGRLQVIGAKYDLATGVVEWI